MAGFWSFRNQHMWMIAISPILGSVIVVWAFYPAYIVEAGEVASAIFLGLIAFTIFVPSYIGRGYPHMFHVYLSWPSRIIYYRSLFVDFEEVESVGKIFDIVPLMKRDERGYEIPKWWGDRWYYPYLIKTAFGVDVEGYGEVDWQVVILDEPWSKFFGTPRDMPWGAELYGELFTHPSTMLLVSQMTPFKVDYRGVEIPVFLGVFSDGGARKITASWTRTLKEAARYSGKFDELITLAGERIYPFKEIEMLGSDILDDAGRAKLEEAYKMKKVKVAPRASP